MGTIKLHCIAMYRSQMVNATVGCVVGVSYLVLWDINTDPRRLSDYVAGVGVGVGRRVHTEPYLWTDTDHEMQYINHIGGWVTF